MVAGSGEDPHGGALLLADVGGGPTGEGLLHKGIQEGQAGINLQVFTRCICRQGCLLSLPVGTAQHKDMQSAQKTCFEHQHG